MKTSIPVLFLFFCLGFISNLFAQNCSINVQSVRQLVIEAPNNLGITDRGEIIFCFSNPSSELKFVNACFRCPNTGEEFWIVQNLPMAAGESTICLSVWFDLDPCNQFPDQHEFEEVEIAFEIADDVVSTKPFFGFTAFQPFFVEARNYIVESNPTTPIDELLPPVVSAVELFEWDSSTPYQFKERGCSVPNIDLDSLNHPPDTTYAGDLNACTPASHSNSIMWLKNQHPELAAHLDSTFSSTDTVMHRAILAELSETMNRPDNDGPRKDTIPRGKQTFVDDYQLQLKVKYQSIFRNQDLLSFNQLYGHFAENQNNKPFQIDIDWVYQELCDGEDVEFDFQCYYTDANGTIIDGNIIDTAGQEIKPWAHSVVLSGAYKVGENWGLTYKDDQDQSKGDNDGLKNSFSWVLQDSTRGVSDLVLKQFHYPIFIDTGSINGIAFKDTCIFQRCYISDIYSESFDANISFDTLLCPPKAVFSDTLKSGIYQAADTLCLSDVFIEKDKELIIQANFIKTEDSLTIDTGAVVKIFGAGCGGGGIGTICLSNLKIHPFARIEIIADTIKLDSIELDSNAMLIIRNPSTGLTCFTDAVFKANSNTLVQSNAIKIFTSEIMEGAEYTTETVPANKSSNKNEAKIPKKMSSPSTTQSDYFLPIQSREIPFFSQYFRPLVFSIVPPAWSIKDIF